MVHIDELIVIIDTALKRRMELSTDEPMDSDCEFDKADLVRELNPEESTPSRFVSEHSNRGIKRTYEELLKDSDSYRKSRTYYSRRASSNSSSSSYSSTSSNTDLPFPTTDDALLFALSNGMFRTPLHNNKGALSLHTAVMVQHLVSDCCVSYI